MGEQQPSSYHCSIVPIMRLDGRIPRRIDLKGECATELVQQDAIGYATPLAIATKLEMNLDG
ncbi:MAG: hypothetical protein ACRC06_19480 [Waterburya sp.]